MIKGNHHIAEGHDPEDGLTHGLDTVEGKCTHDVLQQGQYVKCVRGLTRTCGSKTAVYGEHIESHCLSMHTILDYSLKLVKMCQNAT